MAEDGFRVVQSTPSNYRGRFTRGVLTGFLPVVIIIAIVLFISWLPSYRVERRFFESLNQLSTWDVQRGAEWLLFWVFLVFSLLVLIGAILPGMVKLLRQPFFSHYARLIGIGTGLLTAFIAFGFAVSARAWASDYLLWRNAVETGPDDPVFGRPVGFYLTVLPFRGDLVGGVRGVLIVAIILGIIIWTVAHLAHSAITAYRVTEFNDLRPGPAVSEEAMKAFTSLPPRYWALIALYLGIYQVISTFFIYWYERPALLFIEEGLVAGPGATATTIELPGQLLVILLHAIAAIALLVLAFTQRANIKNIFAVLLIPVLVAVALIPAIAGAYEFFSVRPNELSAQTEYIERTISGTRSGYGLDDIDEQQFTESPAGITAVDLASDPETVQKIRVADPDAFLRSVEQLQEVRTFYRMQQPDVDRYEINGELVQVLLSAREIAPDELPPAIATNFVQRRLQFTHGYGLVVAPARWSPSSETGEPLLIVENIPLDSIEGFPEIAQPRIYIGEEALLDDWVIINTGIDEFDYPGPQDQDIENRYDGPDGVVIGDGFSRLMMMMELGSLKLWTSEYITGESRVLLHRNVIDRVETLAPMFKWAADPLLFVRDDGSLAYVVNGMSTSQYYPYSESHDGDRYQRNSIKAVVDAYTGVVTMYVIDSEDQVTQAYVKAMPDLFVEEPLPEDVQRHLQYPEELFSWQAKAFEIYHTTDVGTIYRGTDLWEVDDELFFNWVSGATSERKMVPYWVLSRIPGEDELHYRSILGFSVAGKQPLAGWMTINNDNSNITAYLLPRGSQTMGSLQFESIVNSNPDISQQLTLWDQEGSSVVRGATVITPLGTGFLYVEPIYLVGEGSTIPQLVRVIAGTQDRVAWGQNLDEALEELVRTPALPSPGDTEGTPTPAPTPDPDAATPTPGDTPTPVSEGEVPDDLSDLTDVELATLAAELFDQAENATDFETRGKALDDLGRVIEEIRERSQ